MSPIRMVRKVNVKNLCFFGTLLLVSFTALPWYALHVGISRAEWSLFLAFAILTGCSITVGYHRLFTHRSFQAHPLVTFLSLFFGAAAFEQSALWWSSLHRDHHRYVDTDQDPYDIKKGFWHAHWGWLLFWRSEPDYSNVKDLQANALVMHQHRHYLLWAITAGVLLPLAIGAATGHLVGAFLLGVVGRLTFVHHSTWCINSVCHVFGRATYDIDATARDHWAVAFLTFGEGYHNFHHRFASDYRNGVRWYQWDPTKWFIAMLSWCGLARKLYRTPQHAILAAKATAEHQRVERALGRQRVPDVSGLLDDVRERYEQLKVALYAWEHWEKESRRIRATVSEASQASLRIVKDQAAAKRRVCLEARRVWVALLTSRPLLARAAQV